MGGSPTIPTTVLKSEIEESIISFSVPKPVSTTSRPARDGRNTGETQSGQSTSSQPTRNHRTVANREFIGMPSREHRDDRFAEYARDFAVHGDMKRKKEGKGEGKVRTLGYHLTASHLLTGNNKKRKSSKRDLTSQRSGKNADSKHENGNNPRNAANPTSPISSQRKGYSWKVS